MDLIGRCRRVVAAALLFVACPLLQAQATPELKSKVDAAVREVLDRTGVPSAQVGIVQDGKIVYTAAYGKARLDPEMPANASMHYPVGSISKQFTAACVLRLVEQGRMTLDDPVAKYFPDLTRAGEVTIRMLLSHTSGYEDYAPQDYTIPAWTKPTTPETTIGVWAKKPLDFDPGTRWQYSNTNFVLAGLIVQKVSGVPFWQFLETQILEPAGIKNVLNLDTDRAQVEPVGYMRYALAALRPALPEAPAWYFADAQMAMPVADLLTWDISIMNQTVLKPSSYATMQTEVKLKDGTGSHYGLGIFVREKDGRRELSHSGEVGGFVSQNIVYPEQKIAVAVLTNQDASAAAGQAAQAVAALLLPTGNGADNQSAAAAATQVKSMLAGLAAGKLDRSLLTSDLDFYFSDAAIRDFESSLKPLGDPAEVKQTSTSLRGGMVARRFAVRFAGGKNVVVSTYTEPDGKLEQFLVETVQ